MADIDRGRRPVLIVGVTIAAVTLVALVAAAIAGVVVLAGDDAVVVDDADFPVALAATPDGGFLYGERLTGRVRAVTADGELVGDPVAEVDLVGSQDDQRGLLGLAVDRDERIFASWTRSSDGRLVVGQVAPDERLVWAGPLSTDRATGGHLALDDDGMLVLGIGDLLDADLLDDPNAPNGKIVVLDPDRGPDQVPGIVSSGWNNPFAFEVTDDGVLWIADNAGPSSAERLARVEAGDAVVTELEGEQVAPAALVSLGDGSFGLCGFLSGVLQRVTVEDGEPVPTDEVVADPCTTGAARLTDGRLVLATETQLRVIDP